MGATEWIAVIPNSLSSHDRKMTSPILGQLLVRSRGEQDRSPLALPVIEDYISWGLRISCESPMATISLKAASISSRLNAQ